MEGFLSKIKEDIEETSRLLWKEADPKDLKPGDHIYAHKKLGSYSHHGIYVGEGFVIHYTQTSVPQASVPNSFFYNKAESPDPTPCPDCGYKKNMDRGVVRTCLDCFRRGDKKLHSIRRFAYGVPELTLLLKKSGTCTKLESSRTADEAVRTAYELFRSKGFGEYKLQLNNCEHFATFCRTGQTHSEQMSFYNVVGDRFKRD